MTTDLLATVRDFAISRGEDYDPADELALMVLEQASDLVRSQTGQHFGYLQDDVVDLAGSGFESILLPQLPALDVTAVQILGYAGDDPLELDVVDWYLDPDGLLFRLPAGCEYWPRGYGNIRVTYSHGWALPTVDPPTLAEDDDVHVAPTPLPSDLQAVVMELAAAGYARASSQTAGRTEEETSRSIMSYSETTRVVDAGDVTPLIQAVLDRYTVAA